MSAADLARPEIRALSPYRPARQEPHGLRLHANEAPWTCDGARGLNRYPPIRPLALQERLAGHYGVPSGNLLVTRGTSEGIDLLVRAFCRPGVDSVIVTPPTFGMYRVYADIQGAAVVSVRLPRERSFALDVERVLQACHRHTRLVFLCSPNNPTGGLIDRADILRIADALLGRSLVVVDEAYVEFSGADSLARAAAGSSNLVVLRTLSKAFALAGARCGSVIGPADAIGLLGGVLAPYALSMPVIDCVLDALAPANLCTVEEAIAAIVRERERLAVALAEQPLVAGVWPSRANFLLVEFADAARARERLRARRILIREPEDGTLSDCARITVGTREENGRLIEALGASVEAA